MTKLNLNDLNTKQSDAVQSIDGVYQIISVAGSGKTRVLTYRVANMILNHNIDPSSILVATFSKKAADEMKERLKVLIGKKVNELFIGTFHSIAFRILAKEYKALNHPLANAFKFDSGSLMPDYLRKKYIDESVKEVGDFPAYLNTGEILRQIGNAKNDLLDAKLFSTECITGDEFKVAKVYEMYEARKSKEAKIDFDDMLLKLYELFIQQPSILKKYQNQYRYLLIDEAQDNNQAQYELMRLIAAPHNNIMIVGDDDQSLYSFRGARPGEFINFKDYYPNLVTIKLEQNYRSSHGILAIANNIIKNNQIRLEKEMIPSSSFNQQNDVSFSVFGNEDEEAKTIVDSIVKYNELGIDLKQCAILFRTSAQTRAIEDYLIREKVPYVIYGAQSFYQRDEIKTLISYVRLIVDKDDDKAFSAIINVPYRYISKDFIKSIQAEAKKRKISCYKALKWVKPTPSQHRNIMKFMGIIDKATQNVQNGNLSSPSALIEWIIKEINYTEYVKQQGKSGDDEEDTNDAIENIKTLVTGATNYNSIQEFLDYVQQATDSQNQKIDCVQMMTIHKSKGLEFKKVFLVGMCETILPHNFALESADPNAVEEERRLAYVGSTRAMENLHLSSLSSFNGKSVNPSRFLEEAGLLQPAQ